MRASDPRGRERLPHAHFLEIVPVSERRDLSRWLKATAGVERDRVYVGRRNPQVELRRRWRWSRRRHRGDQHCSDPPAPYHWISPHAGEGHGPPLRDVLSEDAESKPRPLVRALGDAGRDRFTRGFLRRTRVPE